MSTEPVVVEQDDASEAVRGRVRRVNHVLDSRFGRRVTPANLESARNEMAELAEEHIATLAALAQATAALERMRGEREAEAIAVAELLGAADHAAAAACQVRARLADQAGVHR